MSNPRHVRVPSLQALRDIVSEHQCARFRFKRPSGKVKLVLVDAFTASAMVQAHDSLSSTELQEKVGRLIASGSFVKFDAVRRIAMGGK